MPFDPARAKSLFLTASDLADSAARDAFLDRECGSDSALRVRVEAMLAAHFGSDAGVAGSPSSSDPATEETGAFTPAEGMSGRESSIDEATVDAGPASGNDPESDNWLTDSGETILRDDRPGALLAGKYRLIEPIGEGGMGSVWLAQQSEPVKRRVAVKLIKAGMDSRGVLARFEAERQALAVMDHPNIAKVLDGGLTPDSRPFFVMELVKGVPITQFCDERKMTPKGRLELFVPVCQAIQHAHQKGIIHRDIKPSNVLVALYDDKPVVKVIDFGVAKATGGALTDESIQTAFGGVVGTPQYMSPEQASLNNLDIDTRSDVYSLGILLYELLTGSPPFSRKELEQRGMLEMLRVVREEEPPRPSTKLSSSEALPILSANRGTEPGRLTGLLRNELDWIVMKALEKDRTRRYETANGFAADVLRYLSGEAVFAHPPSTAYRVSKFIRRYRGQVIAVSLVLTTLVAGLIGTAIGLREANRAWAAEQLRADQEAAARREEERQRKFAEAIAAYVKDDFLALTSVEGQDRFDEDRRAALGKDATLEQLLDRAAGKLKVRKDLSPAVEAELCWIVGVSYRANGTPEKAIPFLERAAELHRELSGPDHAQVFEADNSLAGALLDADQAARAVTIWESAISRAGEKLGPDHLYTLAMSNNLATAYSKVNKYERSLALHEEVLRLRLKTLGSDSEGVLESRYQVAVTLATLKRAERAMPLLEETLNQMRARLGAGHPSTLVCLSTLANLHGDAGRHDKAAPMFEEAFIGWRNRLGPDHPKTLLAAGEFAAILDKLGRVEEALPLREQILRSRLAKRGGDEAAVLQDMINLVYGYQDVGRLDLALPLWETLADRHSSKFGPDDDKTLTVLNNLATCHSELGRNDLALPIIESVFAQRRRLLGHDHPETLLVQHNLGATYRDARQLDRAIPLLEDALRRREAKLGPRHRDTMVTRGFLGMAYMDVNRMADAIPILEATFKDANGPARDAIALTLYRAYREGGRAETAAKHFAGLVARAHSDLPAGSVAQGGRLAQLGLACVQAGAFADAEPLLRESLSIRQRTQPDAWSTFSAMSMLGGALLGQKKHGEAEPMLLKGYEGLKARESGIPTQGRVRIVEALDWLIELYTATNKPDEVKKYKEMRAKYPPAPVPPKP